MGMHKESPNPTRATSLCEKKQNTCQAWKLVTGFLEALNARPQTTGSIWGEGALEEVTYFCNLPALLLRQESFKLISR